MQSIDTFWSLEFLMQKKYELSEIALNNLLVLLSWNMILATNGIQHEFILHGMNTLFSKQEQYNLTVGQTNTCLCYQGKLLTFLGHFYFK